MVLAPGSQTSLREANSQRIVDAVKTYGGITQVELAAATGLSAATVSNIVKQLEREGVVETSATTRSGRRALQVTLARASGLSFGVQIGPRAMAVYLADASHGVQHTRHLPLPADHRFDTTLDRVALLVGEAAEEVGASIDDVVAIGVAVPAALDGPPSGAALRGWDDVDIAETLGRRLDRPVVLETSTNAAAVAEARFGALRSIDSALYVDMGETTKASLLLDGVPHRGASGTAGALGHIQVAPAGTICRCGARGCLNTLVSAEALADLVRLIHGPLSLRQLVNAANRGDPGCRQVIAGAGAAAGPVIANAATFLAPARIVIGGELATTGELLLTPIRDALRARPALGRDEELLVPTEIQDHPAAIGAAALAYDTALPSYAPAMRAEA